MSNNIIQSYIAHKTSTASFMTFALVLLSLALTYPAHRFGIGISLLPIQIPLFLGFFLLPSEYALSLVLLIPLANNLVSGMPHLFLALPIMIIEFLIYFITIKYFYFRKHYNILLAIITAQLLGRIIATGCLSLCSIMWHTSFIGILPYFMHITIDFLPGIALQLLLIPIIAFR